MCSSDPGQSEPALLCFTLQQQPHPVRESKRQSPVARGNRSQLDWMRMTRHAYPACFFNTSPWQRTHTESARARGVPPTVCAEKCYHVTCFYEFCDPPFIIT